MMNNCGSFQQLHSNSVGEISYCTGCNSYHLFVKGLLTILEDDQIENVERNFICMEIELKEQNQKGSQMKGVQIGLANNIFLCLNSKELVEAIELVQIGQCMLNINEILHE